MEFVKTRKRINVFDYVKLTDSLFGFVRPDFRRIGSIIYDDEDGSYVWNQKFSVFNMSYEKLDKISVKLKQLNKKEKELKKDE